MLEEAFDNGRRFRWGALALGVAAFALASAVAGALALPDQMRAALAPAAPSRVAAIWDRLALASAATPSDVALVAPAASRADAGRDLALVWERFASGAKAPVSVAQSAPADAAADAGAPQPTLWERVALAAASPPSVAIAAPTETSAPQTAAAWERLALAAAALPEAARIASADPSPSADAAAELDGAPESARESDNWEPLQGADAAILAEPAAEETAPVEGPFTERSAASAPAIADPTEADDPESATDLAIAQEIAKALADQTGETAEIREQLEEARGSTAAAEQEAASEPTAEAEADEEAPAPTLPTLTTAPTPPAQPVEPIMPDAPLDAAADATEGDPESVFWRALSLSARL